MVSVPPYRLAAIRSLRVLRDIRSAPVEPAAGGWINSTQTAELTASKGGAGSFLGYSVTIRGTIVVGGAYGQQVGSNTGQGEVFAYEKPKTGWVNRTENFNLTASGGKAGDELGWSTGIAGLVGYRVPEVTPTHRLSARSTCSKHRNRSGNSK